MSPATSRQSRPSYTTAMPLIRALCGSAATSYSGSAAKKDLAPAPPQILNDSDPQPSLMSGNAATNYSGSAANNLTAMPPNKKRQRRQKSRMSDNTATNYSGSAASKYFSGDAAQQIFSGSAAPLTQKQKHNATHRTTGSPTTSDNIRQQFDNSSTTCYRTFDNALSKFDDMLSRFR